MAEKGIKPGHIIGGLIGAGLIGGLIYALTRPAVAVEVYTCPVCGAEFSTMEELQYHFTTSHPREEIPIEWE